MDSLFYIMINSLSLNTLNYFAAVVLYDIIRLTKEAYDGMKYQKGPMELVNWNNTMYAE